ncbi:hypothetical protein T261_8226 [Streptomyces lydicus]|nr:hypothetical protein T261_8226 [Streptomyces lydicus]
MARSREPMGMDKLHEDEESLSDVGDVEMLMDNYKRDHPTLKLTGLEVLLASLREKDEEINWNWEF